MTDEKESSIEKGQEPQSPGPEVDKELTDTDFEKVSGGCASIFSLCGMTKAN